MTGPRPTRDPLLDAADALEAGHLTHEQLQAMSTPEAKATAHRQDIDLGPWAAAGLGAARGASFGLSDVAQRLLLSNQPTVPGGPSDTELVNTTTSEHPGATTAGTIGGAALPFLLSGGEDAAFLPQTLAGGARTLPGLGAAATRTAIGAAQGAGLTSGDATSRAVGAVLGGGTAYAAPYLARGAGAVGSRVPIVGRVVGKILAGGTRGTVPEAAEETLGPMQPADRPQVPLPVDARQAIADHAAGKITGEDLRTAMDVSAGRTPTPSPRPAVAPTVPSNPLDALRSVPDAALGKTPPVEASAAAPGVTEGRAASAARSFLGRSEQPITTRPGHPFWKGPGTSTTSAEVRGGPTPTPRLTGNEPPQAYGYVLEAMQHPAYQNAEVLARQAVRLGLPGFEGASPADATATLKRMIVEHAEQGQDIPPITTVSRFLERLRAPAAVAP